MAAAQEVADDLNRARCHRAPAGPARSEPDSRTLEPGSAPAGSGVSPDTLSPGGYPLPMRRLLSAILLLVFTAPLLQTARSAPEEEEAFDADDQRLLFTVGRSLSLGQEDCVTWAEVHHKTQQQGEVYGFPDPGYLVRVRQELGEKGVREQAGEASGIKDGSRAERIEATKMTLEEQASINENTSANNQTSAREGFEGSNGFMPRQSSIRVA